MTFLERIKRDTRKEILEAKRRRPLSELKRMIKTAPEIRPFQEELLRSGFGLIAEFKRKSPSIGNMRQENLDVAVFEYEKSSIVRAISVLTNQTHFGGKIEDITEIKKATTKPILRKDFIFDEYQIYEARAYGADAILLMACLNNEKELKKLYRLAESLGLHILCESHSKEEVETFPIRARIHGLNSRKFATKDSGLLSVFSWQRWSRLFAKFSNVANSPAPKDLSTDLSVFNLVSALPTTSIKIAESGVHPEKVSSLIEANFNAALVGTSLLMSKGGISSMLKKFADEIKGKTFSTSSERSQFLREAALVGTR